MRGGPGAQSGLAVGGDSTKILVFQLTRTCVYAYTCGMPVSKNIRRSLEALQSVVYDEIARLVASRAEPEELEVLSNFLKSVKALQTSSWLQSATEGDKGVRGKGDARVEVEAGLSGSEFFEEGESLVKKGQRRGGAGHYMQRVPWATVLRLAETIDGKYASRSFHPAALTRDARVPAYQSYAVLNLLSDKGYLTSPKRGSFKRQNGVALTTVIDSLRNDLPPFIAENDAVLDNHSKTRD